MHLALDVRGTKGFDQPQVVSDLILNIVRLLDLDLVFLHVQEFPNGSSYGPGISGIAIIKESHICIHTAPEKNLIQLCVHSCNDFDYVGLRDLVAKAFGAEEMPTVEQVLAR